VTIKKTKKHGHLSHATNEPITALPQLPPTPAYGTYPSTILTTGAPYRPKHRHKQAGKRWGQWGVVRGKVW